MIYHLWITGGGEAPRQKNVHSDPGANRRLCDEAARAGATVVHIQCVISSRGRAPGTRCYIEKWCNAFGSRT